MLAAILFDNGVFSVAREEIQAQDFFDLGNRRVYAAITQLAKSGSPFDAITILEQIQHDGLVGGVPLTVPDITNLTSWGGTHNVKHHARIVRRTALERELHAASFLLAQANGNRGEIFTRVQEINAKLDSLDAGMGAANFTWENLEMEKDLIATGDGTLPFLVQELLPLDDLTIFFGREGSMKTLLALYIGKCICNGAPVFGNFKVVKKPVLYIDAENQHGTHEVYLRYFEGIGPEQMRFWTLKRGVPLLTDPSLLRLCADKRPFLILDSLVRFSGNRDRDSSEMTAVMEEVKALVTAGASVLLIHHARKADEEEYANSFIIGATVAFLYAIIKEDTGLAQRVRMVHKKARGAKEINRALIGFPNVADIGMFTLDGDAPRTDQQIVVDFVRTRGRCNYTEIKNAKLGISTDRKNAALKEAVRLRELHHSRSKKSDVYSVENIGTESSSDDFSFSSELKAEPPSSDEGEFSAID